MMRAKPRSCARSPTPRGITPIFGCGSRRKRRFVKMIEMRVREQHQVNRRQVLDFQAGALDALQQKQPVRKIRVNQHVQVRELDQKRRVADPGNRHLAAVEFGEDRSPRLAHPRREQCFPDQLPEKRARIEMLGRRQILERARQFPAWRCGTLGTRFRHTSAFNLPRTAAGTNLKIRDITILDS